MSNRVSKSGLGPGSSWHLFAENIAFEEDENPVSKGSLETSETTRLHNEDMKVFGICPAREKLSLVICKQCEKILLPSAVYRHYELKHSKILSSVIPKKKSHSIPKPLTSPTNSSYGRSKLLKSSDNSFIRIEEVDPLDINVKIEEVPLSLPKLNTSAKIKLPRVNIKKLTGSLKQKDDKVVNNKLSLQSKLQQKKIAALKDKEYNPDKHCGVWIADQQRRCTRSLTCKTHSLSLRRLVTGRKRPFDVLLAEHKARIQGGLKDDGNQNANGGASPGNLLLKNGIGSPPSHASTVTSSSFRSSNISSRHPQDHSFLATISSHVQQTCHFQAQLVGLMNDDIIGSSNVPTIQHHPRPMRMNRFGARSASAGSVLFHRKLDRFHAATISMIGRYHNPTASERCDTNSASSLTTVLPPDMQGSRALQVIEEGAWGGVNGEVLKATSANPGSNGRVRSRLLGTNANRPGGGVKRQMSLNTALSKANKTSLDINSPLVPSKRRHSTDGTTLAISNLTKTETVKPADADISSSLKSLNDLGHIVANVDKTNKSQALSNQLKYPYTAGTTNLNSSLNLCQTLELSGLMSNVTNPATIGAVSLGTLVPSRTFTNAQQQQYQSVKGAVKEILPRPPGNQQVGNSKSNNTNNVQNRPALNTIASNGFLYQAVPINDKSGQGSAPHYVVSSLSAGHLQNVIVKSSPPSPNPTSNIANLDNQGLKIENPPPNISLATSQLQMDISTNSFIPNSSHSISPSSTSSNETFMTNCHISDTSSHGVIGNLMSRDLDVTMSNLASS